MTIEEAAATLGLAPHEVAPERVERNYRLKAMHCHPDRASYPGADAEFKRATEAFNRLKQPASWPVDEVPPQVDAAVARAADQFVFTTGYVLLEPWLRVGWAERLDAISGSLEVRQYSGGFAAKNQPLTQLVRKSVASPRTLLIAPVDCEVLEVFCKNLCRLWLLRPLQKARLAQRLQREIAAGADLQSAIKSLRRELFDAARIALTSPTKS